MALLINNHLKTAIKLLSVLIFIGLPSCRQAADQVGRDSKGSKINTANAEDTRQNEHLLPSPQQYTPISFIHSAVRWRNNDPLHISTMFDNFPDNWVQRSDIDTLISLIHSTKKCNCFSNPLSSYIPSRDHAEVGGYAIVFIEAYRQDKKIEMGLFKCPKTNEAKAQELTEWWAKKRDK